MDMCSGCSLLQATSSLRKYEHIFAIFANLRRVAHFANFKKAPAATIGVPYHQQTLVATSKNFRSELLSLATATW